MMTPQTVTPFHPSPQPTESEQTQANELQTLFRLLAEVITQLPHPEICQSKPEPQQKSMSFTV
jgi:hypothetical protein